MTKELWNSSSEKIRYATMRLLKVRQARCLTYRTYGWEQLPKWLKRKLSRCNHTMPITPSLERELRELVSDSYIEEFLQRSG